MTQQEIKKALLKAVQQFENEYPEWSDYTLSLKPDAVTVEVISDSDDTSEIKELLRDFLGALKDNNLMLVEEKANKIVVDEYVYVVEDGLDDLADELEAKFGKQIANLKIQEKNGQPYVRFRYIGNITSDEKEKIKAQIVETTAQYQAVDEEDVFADVDFDDFDEVMDEIKDDNMVEELVESEDEEVKAEDSGYAPGIYYHGSPEFKRLPRVLQDQLRIDHKTNINLYERVPYSDMVEGDWKHDREERLRFIENYKDSHVIVDIDTGGDYVVLLALRPDYIESFELDEENEETYFVIVDSDAPVEYTKEELLTSVSEEDFERLLAGEIIDYVNDDGEEFKVSLVLNNKAEDSDRFDFEIFIKKVTDADLAYLEDHLKLSEDWEEDEKLTDYEPELYVMEDTIRITIWYNTNYKDADIDFDFAKTAENLDILSRYEDSFENVEYAEDSEIKAEDMITDLFAKDQIAETMKLPVNQKTDKIIWEAFRRLDSAIENQDRADAEMLYKFVYAFDIEDAALDMGQYEDLLDKKDEVRARIDAIEDYKAADSESINVEVDYEDYEALADLYDELYEYISRKFEDGTFDTFGEDTAMVAMNEIDSYIEQFTELEEDIPSTLAKLTPEQIEGYVKLINKWMNYAI